MRLHRAVFFKKNSEKKAVALRFADL